MPLLQEPKPTTEPTRSVASHCSHMTFVHMIASLKSRRSNARVPCTGGHYGVAQGRKKHLAGAMPTTRDYPQRVGEAVGARSADTVHVLSCVTAHRDMAGAVGRKQRFCHSATTSAPMPIPIREVEGFHSSLACDGGWTELGRARTRRCPTALFVCPYPDRGLLLLPLFSYCMMIPGPG